jgi:hypothetical protein
MRLLAIPGTSIRRTQRAHDFDQPLEAGADVLSHAVSAPYATIRGSMV